MSLEENKAVVFRLVDGRIAESWHNIDDYGLFHQLGVLPSTG